MSNFIEIYHSHGLTAECASCGAGLEFSDEADRGEIERAKASHVCQSNAQMGQDRNDRAIGYAL